jgi:hypothetical protein
MRKIPKPVVFAVITAAFLLLAGFSLMPMWR